MKDSGSIVRVEGFWARKARYPGYHGYYALSDGSYARHDHLSAFKGVVITRKGAVLESGDPRQGVYVIDRGRPVLILWKTNFLRKALRSHPALVEAMKWFRSGALKA